MLNLVTVASLFTYICISAATADVSEPPRAEMSLPNITARYQTISLTFSSVTTATLYMNGQQKASLPRGGTTYVPLRHILQKGTVVTVIATPATRGGVSPGILLSGGGIGTDTLWRGEFTRKEVSKNKVWTMEFPEYDVCKWKRVRQRGRARRGGMSYVWPMGTCGKDHVSRMRYVVGGGDEHVCHQPRPKKSSAVVTVAATDSASVFVNGRHVMDIKSRLRTKAMRLQLGKGDVIALKVMDKRYKNRREFGFAVDVKYEKKRIVTKEGGEWKVTAMYKTEEPSEQFAFMHGDFDDCSWDAPVLPRYPPRKRATPFPYKHGARYVWARNAQKEGSVVFARMVIEDEPNRCNGMVGQRDHRSMEPCDCEMVASAKNSICYYFKDWRNHHCDDRECEPKYVCTGRDATPQSLLCIRKEISHRIAFEREVSGEKICSLRKDPHYIYVPYDKSL